MSSNKYSYLLIFLQKLFRKAGVITPIISSSVIFTLFAYSSRYMTSLVPLYLDEKVYIECGIKYISGLPPVLCNFEHPPLGKYVIGLFESHNAGVILLVLNYFISLIMLYKITYILTKNKIISLYAMLIVGFDTLFMFTYMHYLLDPIAFTFLLLTTYIYILLLKNIERKNMNTYKDLVFLGMSLGLTVATKWQTIYSLLGMLIMVLWSYFKAFNFKTSFTRIINLSAFAVLAYLTTFAMDMKLGIVEPVIHNAMALAYMSYRHGFSPSLAVIGIMKLLSRVEIWRLASFIVMYVTTTIVAPNVSSLILLNSTYVESPARMLVRIGVGVPSMLWPILFPTYLLVVKARLEGGRFRELDPLIVVTSTSLLNLLNGPLDWYYIYVIPFLYIITITYILSHRKGKYIAALLLLAQFIHCLLFFLKVIPYAIELSI